MVEYEPSLHEVLGSILTISFPKMLVRNTDTSDTRSHTTYKNNLAKHFKDNLVLPGMISQCYLSETCLENVNPDKQVD